MSTTTPERSVIGWLRSVLPCTLPHLFTASGAAVAITFVWWLVLPGIAPSTSGGDTVTYMEMATNPQGVHWSPLAFRGLVPWLAHAIGGTNHAIMAFRFLTWASLMASALAVYLITRLLKGSHGAGLLGLLGGASVPMWLFYVYQPYLTDPAAMAMEGWVMVALLSGWFAVLPVLLVITGLARETVLGYTFPVYMWIRTRLVDWPALWRVAWWILPALVTVWAIRQPMQTTGYRSTAGLMYVGLWTVHRDIVPHPIFWAYYSFAGSLGVWWVFALYGRKVAGRLWWLLVPVFAQCLFGADYGRFLMFAYPVIYTAGAIAVWRHPRRVLLLGIVVLQGLVVFIDIYRSGNLAIDLLTGSSIASGVLMALAAIVLWFPRLGSRRTSSPTQIPAARSAPSSPSTETVAV